MSEKMRELLPCPFCGDTNIRLYNQSVDFGHDYPDDFWTCECHSCEVNICENGIEAAVTAWNRRAALAPQPVSVPEGWKMVPVEPTDEMLRAAFRLDLSYMPGQEGADRYAIYCAMLAAAPVMVETSERGES